MALRCSNIYCLLFMSFYWSHPQHATILLSSCAQFARRNTCHGFLPGLHLLRKSCGSLSRSYVGTVNHLGPWFVLFGEMGQTFTLTGKKQNKQNLWGIEIRQNFLDSRFYISRFWKRTTIGCFSGLPLSQALPCTKCANERT